MQVPLEITFRGLSRTDDIDALLREHVDRLHRFCDDLIHCRVVVEQPQQHQHSGNAYRVRLEVTLPPKKHLVVTKEPGDNDMHAKLRTVLRGAFEAMERQVKDVVEQRRGDVKTHDEPHALVVRLFPEKDYGFLKTLDATEIYFHRNAVLHGDFDRLQIGTEVRFEPSTGDMGPQASSVQIVSKAGARATVHPPLPAAEPPRGWK